MKKDSILIIKIEKHLQSLEEQLIADPRNISYPSNQFSDVYNRFRGLISEAKSVGVSSNVYEERYDNLFKFI